MEIVTVSELGALTARTIDGAVQKSPARPIVLRNARRLGELTEHQLNGNGDARQFY
jgi:hypothetical protein